MGTLPSGDVPDNEKVRTLSLWWLCMEESMHTVPAHEDACSHVCMMIFEPLLYFGLVELGQLFSI